MNEIIDKIYRYIEQNNMLTDCERVVIGLSGGADSVCLLMVLKGYIEKNICRQNYVRYMLIMA